MNLGPAIALAAAAVGLHAAFIWRRFGDAPGWAHHRWFGAASLAASGYALCGFAMNSGAPVAALAHLSSVQLACAIASVAAWQRYADGYTGRPPGRVMRVLRASYLALAAPVLFFPGLFFETGTTTPHVVIAGSLEYNDVGLRPLGAVFSLLALAGALPLLGRFVAAWRRGLPLAGVHALAVASIVPIAASDVLTSMGLLGAPYLLDVGFVLPIAIAASAGAYRFVAEVNEHERLRHDLEREVVARTRQLGRAQSALHEAERLAALGQFAGGIAHEVNNPAAAVSVNLRFIQENADPGPNRDELRLAAGEGIQAMNRIVALVRRLGEAGRLVGSSQPGVTCEVADAILRAVEDVSSRWPDGRVGFRLAPLPGVSVAAPEQDVHHAVLALLMNAGEAVPDGRAGSVAVAVESEGGQVAIRIDDDGTGLDDEALRRAFEPFFSTKPPGRGPGLGLTLAKAFARRHGGDVRLERRAGGGTRAVLTLPVAASARSAA